MIEDIKKDILKEVEFFPSEPYSLYGEYYISQSDVIQILDKYKDKEDKYKNAWEELKEKYVNTLSPIYVRERKIIIQELEQKHGIGVE